jgi:hypothetical protein
MKVRKWVTIVEEIFIEGQKDLKKPNKKAAAIVVLKNPFAGRYEEDLTELVNYGDELGRLMGDKLLKSLKITAEEVESYGKAAIVGEDGELEHGAALLHSKMGPYLRDLVIEGKAMMPSATKRGGLGTSIDIPLHYKKACLVRSNFDAMEIRLPDAPNKDEIVLAVSFTDSGRPLPRVGGLKKEDVKGEDGVR